MTTHRLDIDLNKICKQCEQPGATKSGYCLSCAAASILDGKGDPTKSNEPEFRGDWAEADQSVIDMAAELIHKHHPWLQTANIGFLFRKEAPLSKGRYTLGRAQKVTDKLRPFMDYDFLIWVAKDQWDRFTTDRRLALLDHELCHCAWGDNGWTMRPHDIEEFTEIIDRHGFWTPELLHVQDVASRQQALPGFEQRGRLEAVKANLFDALED